MAPQEAVGRRVDKRRVRDRPHVAEAFEGQGLDPRQCPRQQSGDRARRRRGLTALHQQHRHLERPERGKRRGLAEQRSAPALHVHDGGLDRAAL